LVKLHFEHCYPWKNAISHHVEKSTLARRGKYLPDAHAWFATLFIFDIFYVIYYCLPFQIMFG